MHKRFSDRNAGACCYTQNRKRGQPQEAGNIVPMAQSRQPGRTRQRDGLAQEVVPHVGEGRLTVRHDGSVRGRGGGAAQGLRGARRRKARKSTRIIEISQLEGIQADFSSVGSEPEAVSRPVQARLPPRRQSGPPLRQRVSPVRQERRRRLGLLRVPDLRVRAGDARADRQQVQDALQGVGGRPAPHHPRLARHGHEGRLRHHGAAELGRPAQGRDGALQED